MIDSMIITLLIINSLLVRGAHKGGRYQKKRTTVVVVLGHNSHPLFRTYTNTVPTFGAPALGMPAASCLSRNLPLVRPCIDL